MKKIAASIPYKAGVVRTLEDMQADIARLREVVDPRVVSHGIEGDQVYEERQEAVADAANLEKFTDFRAVLAVAPAADAPLIFDVLYAGRVFLVALALAHQVEEGIKLSEMNAPLWKPLKHLSGERVLQPLFGSTIEEVHACLASMKNYESETGFLVMCDSVETIQRAVRSLHAPVEGSFRVH